MHEWIDDGIEQVLSNKESIFDIPESILHSDGKNEKVDSPFLVYSKETALKRNNVHIRSDLLEKIESFLAGFIEAVR